MLEIKKSDFIAQKYNKLHLLTNHKNGNQTYEYECKCDRCEGLGKAISHICNGQPVFYLPDNGVCYKCLGTGVMTQKIKVIPDENWVENKNHNQYHTREWYEENIRRYKEEALKKNTEKGFKKVDFKIAAWFLGGKTSEPMDIYSGRYYIIDKETEKAVHIVFLTDGMDNLTTDEEWFPKKAIIKN